MVRGRFWFAAACLGLLLRFGGHDPQLGQRVLRRFGSKVLRAVFAASARPCGRRFAGPATKLLPRLVTGFTHCRLAPPPTPPDSPSPLSSDRPTHPLTCPHQTPYPFHGPPQAELLASNRQCVLMDEISTGGRPASGLFLGGGGALTAAWRGSTGPTPRAARCLPRTGANTPPAPSSNSQNCLRIAWYKRFQNHSKAAPKLSQTLSKQSVPPHPPKQAWTLPRCSPSCATSPRCATTSRPPMWCRCCRLGGLGGQGLGFWAVGSQFACAVVGVLVLLVHGRKKRTSGNDRLLKQRVACGPDQCSPLPAQAPRKHPPARPPPSRGTAPSRGVWPV